MPGVVLLYRLVRRVVQLLLLLRTIAALSRHIKRICNGPAVVSRCDSLYMDMFGCHPHRKGVLYFVSFSVLGVIYILRASGALLAGPELMFTLQPASALQAAPLLGGVAWWIPPSSSLHFNRIIADVCYTYIT